MKTKVKLIDFIKLKNFLIFIKKRISIIANKKEFV